MVLGGFISAFVARFWTRAKKRAHVASENTEKHRATAQQRAMLLACGLVVESTLRGAC